MRKFLLWLVFLLAMVSLFTYVAGCSVQSGMTKVRLNEVTRSVFYAPHDISEAISMSDKVVVLTKRLGSIKRIYRIKLT